MRGKILLIPSFPTSGRLAKSLTAPASVRS